jgi:hypothetical protein
VDKNDEIQSSSKKRKEHPVDMLANKTKTELLAEAHSAGIKGILTTGGIFLLILLLVSAFEPKVEAKFMDIAVRKFYNKWHENDAEQSDMTGQEANLDTEVEDTTEQEEHEHKNQ